MIDKIRQFKKLFQLHQKGNRFSLYINNYPKNEFIRLFFNSEIENLNFIFINPFTGKIQSIKNNNLSSFENYIDLINLSTSEIKDFNGYFTNYDFYFCLNENTIILNYIHRDFLSQLIDILLYELDCNFIGRLKTELLINMEYD